MEPVPYVEKKVKQIRRLLRRNTAMIAKTEKQIAKYKTARKIAPLENHRQFLLKRQDKILALYRQLRANHEGEYFAVLDKG